MGFSPHGGLLPTSTSAGSKPYSAYSGQKGGAVMEFWTANTPIGPATLCDRCALFAVNSASWDYIRRPFGSMAEVMEYFERKCAEAQIEPLNLTQAQTGVCGNCGEDQLQEVS